MYRAVLALFVVVLAADPLLAQRRGGSPTRAPGRSGPIPGLGTAPPTIRPDRAAKAVKSGPVPFPADRQWVRMETPHFSIFSSVGARMTRTIADDLERLTALLVATSPYFRPSHRRTRVFLFGDFRDAQPYFDAARGVRLDAAGLTVRHPAGSTILVDCSARGGNALTPRHELVHDLLSNNARPLPLWIEEGLAEYYSNRGRPIVEHVSRLRGKPRIPLDQLFLIGYSSPRAASWDFYAQSWGAVAVLVRLDPAAFEAFVRDVDGGKSTETALQEHYAMTPKELENAIRRRAGRYASAILADKVSLGIEPEPLSRAALLSELGELMARIPNRAADAQRHYAAALEANAHR